MRSKLLTFTAFVGSAIAEDLTKLQRLRKDQTQDHNVRTHKSAGGADPEQWLKDLWALDDLLEEKTVPSASSEEKKASYVRTFTEGSTAGGAMVNGLKRTPKPLHGSQETGSKEESIYGSDPLKANKKLEEASQNEAEEIPEVWEALEMRLAQEMSMSMSMSFRF